jgi:hypothetical protein
VLREVFDPQFIADSTCGCRDVCAGPECGDCACDACSAPDLPAPTVQQKIVHGLRVLVAPAVSSPDDAGRRLGGDDGQLAEATRLLAESDSGEGDAACCMALELASVEATEPSDIEDVDGNALFTPDIVNGQAQLDRIHVALAERSTTALYVRSMMGPQRAGSLLGQAEPARGTMVVEYTSGPGTWAHEFGHLQGLGHYTDSSAESRVMYEYGDTSHPGTVVSCRDCDYLRVSVPERRTLSTVLSHEVCRMAAARANPPRRPASADSPYGGGCTVSPLDGGTAGTLWLLLGLVPIARRSVRCKLRRQREFEFPVGGDSRGGQ